MKLINISSWGLRRSDVWIQWEGGDGLFIFIFHLKFSTTRGALSLDSSFIFDSMPTRSGIHIVWNLWSQQSGWIPFWMGVSIVQQDSSKHSNSIISSVPSRLTRHSVRASAIASPETSQSRGVTGFGTGCGKWPLGRPSPFCRFFSPTARQLVLHLDGQLKGLTLPPPSFHANFSLSVY